MEKKRLKRVAVFGIAIFIFCLYSTIFILEAKADIVYLKNGRSVKGLIKKETEESLELDVGIGTVKFRREEIESIHRSNSNESAFTRQGWQRQEELEKEKRLKRTENIKKKKEFRSQEGIDFINTDNYANTRLEFFYYIPSTVIKNKQRVFPVLVCIPGLSGKGQDFVSSIFKEFAEKEGFVIVAPSFMWDKDNWNTKKSYQYPSVWSGAALIEIINKLQKEQSLSLSKLYLYGFSAGAQFALRFAIWKPELCAASAAHASGGTVIPVRRIPVKFYVSVGKEDKTRIEKSENFYNKARRLGIEVIYKQYEGGHSLPEAQIRDSLRFFKEAKR